MVEEVYRVLSCTPHVTACFSKVVFSDKVVFDFGIDEIALAFGLGITPPPPSPISDEDDLRHATAALSVHTDLRLLGHVLMGP